MLKDCTLMEKKMKRKKKKVAGFYACNFIEKRLRRSCFPVSIMKFQEQLFY